MVQWVLFFTFIALIVAWYINRKQQQRREQRRERQEERRQHFMDLLQKNKPTMPDDE